MKKRLLIVSLTVVLLAVVYLIYLSANKVSSEAISDISISGNKYIDTAELNKTLNSLVIGKENSSLDLMKLEALIQSNVFVDKVDISIKQSTLNVEIIEKTPAAYYVDKGEVKLLSDDMTLLPLKLNIDKSLVPVVQIVNGDLEKAKKELSDYFKIIDEDKYRLLRLIISEIIYNAETKELNVILNQNSLLVKFGRKEVWEDAAFKFLKFWENVSQREPIEYKTIDLRWKKKVLVS